MRSAAEYPSPTQSWGWCEACRGDLAEDPIEAFSDSQSCGASDEKDEVMVSPTEPVVRSQGSQAGIHGIGGVSCDVGVRKGAVHDESRFWPSSLDVLEARDFGAFFSYGVCSGTSRGGVCCEYCNESALDGEVRVV